MFIPEYRPGWRERVRAWLARLRVCGRLFRRRVRFHSITLPKYTVPYERLKGVDNDTKQVLEYGGAAETRAADVHEVPPPRRLRVGGHRGRPV